QRGCAPRLQRYRWSRLCRLRRCSERLTESLRALRHFLHECVSAEQILHCFECCDVSFSAIQLLGLLHLRARLGLFAREAKNLGELESDLRSLIQRVRLFHDLQGGLRELLGQRELATPS